MRRGTDVLKALALGAKAVFIGRPVLWGLSCQVKSFTHFHIYFTAIVKKMYFYNIEFNNCWKQFYCFWHKIEVHIGY